MKVEVKYKIYEDSNTALVEITLPNGQIWQIEAKDTSMSIYTDVKSNKCLTVQPVTNSGVVLYQSTKQPY